MARRWKGPWLDDKGAADWCGKSVKSFARFLRRSVVLDGAKQPKGEGTIRIEWVYPREALDVAMSTEGHSVAQIAAMNERNAPKAVSA